MNVPDRHIGVEDKPGSILVNVAGRRCTAIATVFARVQQPFAVLAPGRWERPAARAGARQIPLTMLCRECDVATTYCV